MYNINNIKCNLTIKKKKQYQEHIEPEHLYTRYIHDYK